MRHVIRYLLEGDGSVPKFVANGGYFMQGEDLVGISIDDEKRHLPVTVIKLTKLELIARILATQVDSEGQPLTQEAAEDMADSFLAENDLEDYQ